MTNNRNVVEETNILFMQKDKYNNLCYPEMLKYYGKLVNNIDGYWHFTFG